MQYPYIPNSNEAVRKEMLDFIGAKSVEEIYSFIPDEVRMKKPLDIPAPFTTEQELSKHMNSILAEDSTCEENISFLGAGCYDHYVPAICDEINGRSKALVPENMNPNLLSQMTCYCEGMQLIGVKAKENGQMDLEDLKAKLDSDVAAVFIQNPCFLGFFEEQGKEIGELAHSVGAEYVVYADPSSLGITEPPADYGADISCGEIQPLGIHMSFGAGLGGYLATRQEEKYVMNYPHHLHNIFKNSKGQFGYSRALPERTSYYVRDKGVEYLGTCVGLWTVTAAVYLALMGPEGMRELGENILYKSNYAQKKLAGLKGVTMPYAGSHSFMEFVLNLDGTGKTVAEINKALLAKHIFGGYDLSREMPQLGQSMLVCVTEKTALSDIDKLADALAEIL